MRPYLRMCSRISCSIVSCNPNLPERPTCYSLSTPSRLMPGACVHELAHLPCNGGVMRSIAYCAPSVMSTGNAEVASHRTRPVRSAARCPARDTAPAAQWCPSGHSGQPRVPIGHSMAPEPPAYSRCVGTCMHRVSKITQFLDSSTRSGVHFLQKQVVVA